FLGDARDQLAAKTAAGVAYWRPEWCLGQFRLDGCRADLGLPDLTVAEAASRGVKTMLIGVANQGGFIAANWTAAMLAALECGIDLASGLHARLSDIDAVRETAARLGRRLIDVRHPTRAFKTGTGAKRPGNRLLTVGTDCSCGKMYTALALERALRARGVAADFRATGQTGIFIAGEGVSVDAVVADFISGATEWLSPGAAPEHWDLIEGQGSLFHPAYAGVSLGLLHGAQPDALVLCHEPTRTHMRGLPHYPIPSLGTCLEANLGAARLTNPAVRLAGISINTSALPPERARAQLEEIELAFGVPCVDPVLTGVDRIAAQLC
ncbi:MAG: DUF1611 domain-containing protein, partial [Alphaproteobacteria bacterium]|nr:DUF1611 domain-containing protein [Alphaproteobacteria bacterium]